MARKLYDQVNKILEKIFRESYVADVSIKTVKDVETDLPYQRTLQSRKYNDPVKFRGFFDHKFSEQVSLGFGRKMVETGSCLIRVEELKMKGLWDYNKNVAMINDGVDLFILFNREYTIESVTSTILLEDKYIFADIKFNIASYEKDFNKS